jgi:signal transduction histidine kinase
VPDGPVSSRDDAAADQGQAADPSLAADARLIRRVRLRLIAWSGLSTLVVLLVLGIAMYAIAARSLESAGTAQLEARRDEIEHAVQSGRPGPSLGQIFGGRASGTIALLVDQAGDSIIRPGPAIPEGLPVLASIDAAAVSGEDIRTSTIEGVGGPVPVRVLTERLETRTGDPVFMQIAQDRVTEQQTLDAMIRVLLLGGALVVFAALGFGAIYAERALVPIRESLASQRGALRRQREFAADASHELRTPLTVVRSSVEHLRRHPDAPLRDQAEAFDDIDAEVTHLTGLVDDLLLLARSDSGALSLTPMPTDLGDVVADAASSLAKTAEERGVVLRVDPAPTVVRADAARVRQVVTILVDNAIRHTPRGGEVRVAVRADGSAAALDVEDDGPGIREADMPHVFDRFWRAPGAPSGGTGLGLAIARTIVEQHGGRIMVSNGPAGGARFRALLPLEGASASAG